MKSDGPEVDRLPVNRYRAPSTNTRTISLIQHWQHISNTDRPPNQLNPLSNITTTTDTIPNASMALAQDQEVAKSPPSSNLTLQDPTYQSHSKIPHPTKIPFPSDPYRSFSLPLHSAAKFPPPLPLYLLPQKRKYPWD